MRPPEFWHYGNNILGRLLAPLGWVYQFAGKMHRAGAQAERVGVPVICVGNLIVGGAGKTPVALDIGARLLARERAIHYLTRGYGGTVEGPVRVGVGLHDATAVGDEPLLLARIAPTWVARKRVMGAREAVKQGADCLVMDDGLQNPWIAKDLSILVVDGGYGFGNGQVLPAGPLRESMKSGLARIDAVIIIGKDTTGCAAALSEFAGPVLRARMKPGPEAKKLRDRRVLAFAGIGRPDKFFQTLEDIGCRLIQRESFDDHYAYTRADMEELVTQARRQGAALVTTEKDYVRVPKNARGTVEVLTVSLEWDDERAIESLLDRVAGDGG